MITTTPTMPRSGAIRSPARMWLRTAVTLGIYAVRHHFLINRELRNFGIEVRPWASTLALFPGIFVVAPAVVTLWRTCDRIGVAQETAGLVPTADPHRAVASIFLVLFVPYHQREVNRVWRAERRVAVTRIGARPVGDSA